MAKTGAKYKSLLELGVVRKFGRMRKSISLVCKGRMEI